MNVPAPKSNYSSFYLSQIAAKPAVKEEFLEFMKTLVDLLKLAPKDQSDMQTSIDKSQRSSLPSEQQETLSVIENATEALKQLKEKLEQNRENSSKLLRADQGSQVAKNNKTEKSKG